MNYQDRVILGSIAGIIITLLLLIIIMLDAVIS
jgi:hypothetical protein